MQYKERQSAEQNYRQSTIHKKKEETSRASSGSLTPRRKLRVIKSFSQTRYGIPLSTQIVEIDGSNQSFKELPNEDTSKKTICEYCRQKTLDIETKTCGKTAYIWCVLLSPCCLCLIPAWMNSCRDTDHKCVQCWQLKKRVSANFFFCQ